VNKLLCCLVLALPLHRLSVTSRFGWRIHPITRRLDFHAGVDLRANGDTVYAMMDGPVQAGYNTLLGNYIRLGSGDLEIVYGHLSQIFVLTGDSVRVDQPVAVTGSTGRVTAPHLHFAVRYQGRYINPITFLIHAMQYINLK
jgi:murein DD-endopeptidase MepM/ murein hydrolase activator NlpD